MTEDQSEQNDAQIRRVMGIFAHPDDPEFFAGGALARWTAEGAQITLVLATSGDKGSEELEMTHEKLIEIREQEERNAADALGVDDVIFLRYPDGELIPSLELRRTLTRLIRMKQPDTVVTCDPTAYWYGTRYINHPDHRAIGEVTMAAVFPAARDRLNFIELERDEGLIPHKVKYLYLAGPAEPTVSVDITNYIETKINALRQHVSQIKDMDEMAKNIRERHIDAKAPEDAPRLVELFRVFTLA
jgi:LmbE family N-acetylglucosaminyl deacetylase